MPFGGAGALHAGALIKEIDLASALVPRFPGITSALGCVIADMRHDFVLTLNRMLDALDLDAIERERRRMTAEGNALLDGSGVPFTGREVMLELDMSYVGQTHTVAAPIPLEAGALTRDGIKAAFERRYRELYGRLLEGIAIRVLNMRLAVVGRRPKLDLMLLAHSAKVEDTRRGTRRTYVEGRWVEASVYRRLDLPAGATIDGPAILEQPDATIFVDPGLAATVDRFGNLVIARKPE
jgi:N-methylhydantoinase A